MSEFIETLASEFEKERNLQIATDQKAYMRNQFDFFGLKANERREIQKPFLVKAYLPPKADLADLVTQLWLKPERDFQLFGQELVFKYNKQFEKLDLELLEFMVVHKSWWDTVDYISYKLMGEYFKRFPEEIEPSVNKWLKSNNIWLQRSALLFQLKYKKDINSELLSHIIHSLLGSSEFFINKAIGWVLREYSRTNPKWVIEFVENTPSLNNLSKREALRLLH